MNEPCEFEKAEQHNLIAALAQEKASAPETRIESRGNPDGPDIHGNELEPVHYKMPTHAHGTEEPKPACNNGAFNIRWTKSHELATCPKCRGEEAQQP